MTDTERLEDILSTINESSYNPDNFDKLERLISDEHHQAEDKSLYKIQLKTAIVQQAQSFKNSPKSHKTSNYREFTTEFSQCVSTELSRLKRLM